MTIYYTLYVNLCQSRKSMIEHYRPGSELHRHHILPKHSGGSDADSNLTYLTVREHIIAHFLLWKIHKNVNDLRAMHMLGAKLTYAQRRQVGIWCAENKIGFHSEKFTPNEKTLWRLKGLSTQRDSGNHNTWYWWSTEEGRKTRASLGGHTSFASGNNPKFNYWASPEGRHTRASMGGKAHTGKKCMYKPGDITFKRVKPEDVQLFLELGYVFGSPIKPHNKIID